MHCRFIYPLGLRWNIRVANVPMDSFSAITLLHFYCMGEYECSVVIVLIVVNDRQIESVPRLFCIWFLRYKNVSKTDIKQSWLKCPKSRIPKECQTFDELFSENRNYRYLRILHCSRCCCAD